MRVELLEDIKRSGGSVEMTVRRNRIPVVWEKGAVVEMSDASAEKYIRQGKAKRHDGPVSPAAD